MPVNPFWPAVLAGAAGVAGVLVWYRSASGRVLGRRLLIAVLVLVAGLRPGFGAGAGQGQVTSLDVVVMLDRSLSMVAEDYNGASPRMEGARADIRLLLERFPGARFSVVTFDYVGRLELPLTTDTTAVMSLVEVAGPREYLNKGSSIDAGQEAAETVLARSAERTPKRQRMLVYIGDGEQTTEAPVRSFAGLRTYLSGALVLGYGTSEGGRMKEGSSYVTDVTTLSDARSTIDEGNLQRIASELGGSYQHRTAPGPLQVAAPGTQSTGAQMVSAGNDWAWLVGLLLLVPVLWELWDSAHLRRAAGWLAGGRKEPG